MVGLLAFEKHPYDPFVVCLLLQAFYKLGKPW